MRAVVYTESGDSSVLELVEREAPEPGPGEVRVRIVRAGVNPTDWKFRAGGMGELAFPEIVPGQDGAGDVDAVGPGVTDLAVGDRVWTMLAQHTRPGGTAQELVVLPVANVAKLPDAASYDLGASIGVPAVTAHRALTTSEDGPDRLAPGALAGTTVLVAGGAGAVGNAAIQLARWAGATVISTVSRDEKAALARAAGAQHVVNYRDGDTAAAIRDLAPEGVDLVVEVAPAQNLRLDLGVIKPRGTIAIYANNGGDAQRARDLLHQRTLPVGAALHRGPGSAARGGGGRQRRGRRRRVRRRRRARPAAAPLPPRADRRGTRGRRGRRGGQGADQPLIRP